MTHLEKMYFTKKNNEQTIDFYYTPKMFKLPNTEIVLIKCTQVEAIQNGLEDNINKQLLENNYLSAYYTQTKDNHLSDIVSSPINIINIKSSHYNWVKDFKSINIIKESITNKLLVI